MIAKDADYLEQAFQGKIFVETGFPVAQNWIDNVGKALKTESAKQVWGKMVESHSTDWWLKTTLKRLEDDKNR